MKHQKGFTLTEVMVAVAIGLISSVVIFKAMQSSNIINTAVGGGADSTTNGQIALYSIERDIRMAGYGMNEQSAVGCRVIYTNSNLTLPTDIVNNNAILAPVSLSVINGSNLQTLTDAQNNPTIRVAYAGLKFVANSRLTRDFNGGNQPLAITNQFGFTDPGTVLLLTGPAAPTVSMTPCMTRQVTGVSGSDIFIQASPAFPLNNAAGVAMTNSRDIEYKVFSMGSLAAANLNVPANIPNWNEYRVNRANATLEVRNLFTTTDFTTVANNIADMYVDYLLADGTVQASNAKTQTLKDSTTNDLSVSRGWNNIVGVRVALLSRGSAPDYSQGSICKTEPTNAKTVTPPTSPTLQPNFLDNAGNLVAPFVLNTTINPDAHCYRYRVHQSVIMMRNMTWRP